MSEIQRHRLAIWGLDVYTAEGSNGESYVISIQPREPSEPVTA